VEENRVIIDLSGNGRTEYLCDFCRKSKDEVKVLIQSPCGRVHICDECVDGASRVVEERRR
jgi:hypothetical protein